MVLLLNLVKLGSGIAAIALVVVEPRFVRETGELSGVLLLFGIVLVIHELFFELVGFVKALVSKSLGDWLSGKVIPKSAASSRLGLDGEKQLLTWLVSASGVIIGLVAFDQGSVPRIEKIGAGALVTTIVSGILYMNVLAGGISAEDNESVTIEGFNFQLSLIFLNLSYWTFALGVICIFFGLFDQDPTPGGEP
jgi:hypothetical protein